MEHSFSVKVAELHGILASVILKNIIFWCDKNRSEKSEQHYHDGYYWTYNSVRAWAEMIPYATEKQIRQAIDKLRLNGLIVAKHFGNNVLWYTPTLAGLELYGIAPDGKQDCPTGQTEIAPEGKPYYTDINNTIVNTYNNTTKTGYQVVKVNRNFVKDHTGKEIKYSTIMEKYNTYCPRLEPLREVTYKYMRALNVLFEIYSAEDLYKAFKMANESDFLCGSSKTWQADFAWLINADNVRKVLSGKYNSSYFKFEQSAEEKQKAIENFLNNDIDIFRVES